MKTCLSLSGPTMSQFELSSSVANFPSLGPGLWLTVTIYSNRRLYYLQVLYGTCVSLFRPEIKTHSVISVGHVFLSSYPTHVAFRLSVLFFSFINCIAQMLSCEIHLIYFCISDLNSLWLALSIRLTFFVWLTFASVTKTCSNCPHHSKCHGKVMCPWAVVWRVWLVVWKMILCYLKDKCSLLFSLEDDRELIIAWLYPDTFYGSVTWHFLIL